MAISSFFNKSPFRIGNIQSLEVIRKSMLSGGGMAAFIETGNPDMPHMKEIAARMTPIVNIALDLIITCPIVLRVMALPYLDYLAGVQCTLNYLDSLPEPPEPDLPQACAIYWDAEKPEEEPAT